MKSMDTPFFLSGDHLGSKAFGGSALKPARKKRFAPKTRTGCLICRARRIKCDEVKPSCRRCVKSGHACRYALEELSHSSAKQFQRDIQVVEAADSNADVTYLQSLLPNYGSLEETCYLGKFLTVSAPWLSTYNDGSFFHIVLPQRSWHHPALRHTLVAIAMATEQARCPLDFTANKQHHWHHSQALWHIYTAKNTEEEAEVILLTSAMMWLHDNITSHSRTAVVHLQGFLRLLTEYRVKRQQRGLPPTDFESQLLRGLVFHADVSENAFTQVRGFDVVRSIRERLRDSKYKSRFPTMKGVCDELRLGLTAVAHSTATPRRMNVSRIDDEYYDDNASITTTELRTYFEKWYRTFNAIPKSSSTDSILLECHYICAALALQVHQISSSPDSPSALDDQQSLDRMHYVMDRLDEIDMADLEQIPGTQDVELPLSQILAQLIAVTNNSSIRIRAYDYLRRVKRVEGLWSSDMVADMMWVAHPPDYPTETGANTRGIAAASTVSDPLAESLKTWQVPISLASTESEPSLYSDVLEEARSTADVEESNAAQTPLSGTGTNRSLSQGRISEGELVAGAIRPHSKQVKSVLDSRPDENHARELRRGGRLLVRTMLSNSTWTLTSLTQPVC